MPMTIRPIKSLVRRLLLAVAVASLSVELQTTAQEGNQPPIDLSRNLTEFRVVRPEWAAALGNLLYKVDIPYLLELDTLTYRDMSVRDKLGLFTGSEEQRLERGKQWATAFKMDLKNVTTEQALKEILKDQPRYTYEVLANGRCLHVFPLGIQERKDWPLNREVKEFSIEQQELADQGYRKTFGIFLLKYQIHIGEMGWGGPLQCLAARRFHNVTLRELLAELSGRCGVGWTVEPFAQEEIKFRETYNKEYYERGYDIGRPGSNGWYQIHFSFLENQTQTGTAQGK